MNYHVALLQLITGTPFAEPQQTFNDLSLEEQFTRLQGYAQKADAYRATTTDPNAPVFLIAPEYTFAAHPRDTLGDVTHRFLPNATKKQVLETARKLSQSFPKVVFIFSISWLKDTPGSDGTTEGRNTTYVYYKGEKIFSQHKNGDAGELLPGDTNSGVRYRDWGSPVSTAKAQRQPVDAVFMVEGKPFGIETCCDFGCRLPFSVGQPQSSPQAVEKLEGQFLISATIDHTQTAIDSGGKKEDPASTEDLPAGVFCLGGRGRTRASHRVAWLRRPALQRETTGEGWSMSWP